MNPDRTLTFVDWRPLWKAGLAHFVEMAQAHADYFPTTSEPRATLRFCEKVGECASYEELEQVVRDDFAQALCFGQLILGVDASVERGLAQRWTFPAAPPGRPFLIFAAVAFSGIHEMRDLSP